MAGSIAAQKRTLRQKAIATRIALTDRDSRSRAIADRLESEDLFRNASAILTYVSKPEEVNTRGIIERALASGRAVLTPRVGDNQALEWVRIEAVNALQTGSFGVMEPIGPATTLEISSDGVALIPGVAFDRAGFRLGWGKGFFDRFLATFAGASIGLAFDCQLYESLPREPHDRAVDYVITETEIIYANQRSE